MTRKEKIIEILNKYQSTIPPLHNEGMIDPMDFHKIADAILSLPLDVPSEEEIRTEFAHNYNAPFEESYEQSRARRGFNHDQSNKRIGAKWMRNEILKRNGIQESEEK